MNEEVKEDTKLQGRTWLGTLNNPEDVEGTEEYLRNWSQQKNIRYVNGQLERGEHDTLHV